MNPYDPSAIEKKWQDRWEKDGIYKATDNDVARKKFYALIEFPYPSGAGLHTGHIRSNTAMDIIARKRRMEGQNVLYPIGWDAFGLPTENYAIKTGVHPREVTKQNTDTFRRQLKSLGFSFDWSREIDTTNPAYYKWTQWIFLQMFKGGLAYKAKMPINWCPSCKIGLANEEVVDGKCERCGGPTEKREKEQWMLAITKYADRLDKDLDDVDYLEKIKIQQRNWIGRSEGAEIGFKIHDTKSKNELGEIKVFTTRPDTLFGCTYCVLAPEHPLVEILKDKIKNRDEVVRYIVQSRKKTEMERTAEGEEKTGVELKGIKAINPANSKEVPVFIADYVLAHYGTGAIMAVPAHDERDRAFARKFGLYVREVVAPNFTLSGINTPKTDTETLERKTVSAIIEHNGRFLLLKDAENVYLVGGGVDNGEEPENAIEREIKEETGYQNFKIEKILISNLFCLGFRHTKKKNQKTNDIFYYVRLSDDKKTKVDDEETNKHSSIWLDKKDVLVNITWEHHKFVWEQFLNPSPFTGPGILVSSGQFDGMESGEAKRAITEFVGGEMKTTYKLRDWIFSRQRYWGEPIPLVFCEHCAGRAESPKSKVKSDEQSEGEKMNLGWFAVSEEELPVTLPDVEKYEPTDTGESPLATMTDWVNTKCPSCGGQAKRETDTMPQWAGSSWYYLRYIDPHNNVALADAEKIKYWTPIDWYNGGMEHTTLHLLYSRFWHKFLYDIGVVSTHEPYAKRTSHGMILAEGGVKMSKSKGNAVSPDDIVVRYGADTLRIYEMFMGPFDQSVAWSEESIVGSRRFLEKVWRLSSNLQQTTNNRQRETILHKTIKKVGEDIEVMSFNTAISAMMIFVNAAEKEGITKDQYETFLKLLAPFAPHITEELWCDLGHSASIHLTVWPMHDEAKMKEDTATIAVQVNGKVRDSFIISADTEEGEIKQIALDRQIAKKWTDGKKIVRVIVVKGKLVSIVTE